MVFLCLPWGLITTQNIISLKAQDRIWIGSRLTDTRSAENDWIGADTDPQYRIDTSLVYFAQNYLKSLMLGVMHFINHKAIKTAPGSPLLHTQTKICCKEICSN